ncbi:MAG: HAD family hydrolase [Chloroflexi bacterium]|nr:HAD family hydrolase [Chloroflexota bacterium]
MVQAVLLDLDDTLLGNDMDTFMHHYFRLLGEFATALMDKDKFLQELLVCTRAMIMNVDTAVTNRDVFWQTFAQRNDMNNIDELEQFFDTFYREQFPQLEKTTQRYDAAAQLINWCQENDLKVVIATNPVFPTYAIEERLRWAGIPAKEHWYDLVTTYDNMHSTKPHPSYYREILDEIDCPAKAALMVGNDWENDIVPAAECGLATYWIAADDAPLPAQLARFFGQGSLDKIAHQISEFVVG